MIDIKGLPLGGPFVFIAVQLGLTLHTNIKQPDNNDNQISPLRGQSSQQAHAILSTQPTLPELFSCSSQSHHIPSVLLPRR